MAEVAHDSASKTRPQSRFKRPSRSMEEEAKHGILSPSFRSAAAMVGWDEDALLIATLVVEDTPVRESQLKKRLSQNLKTPLPSSSSSIKFIKRRFRRQLADPIPAVDMYRDDDEEISSHLEVEVMEKESDGVVPDEGKKGDIGEVPNGKEDGKEVEFLEKEADGVVPYEGKKGEIGEVPTGEEDGKGVPYMDKLKEELSCAICLEICYEPSTTPCGHSFCKKCLKCATSKGGKTCPKCRQQISNGRLGTVNTILWNTIQLLFPEEMEARKKAVAFETSSRKDFSNYGSKLERVHRNISKNVRCSNINSSSSSSFRNAVEPLEVAEGERSTRRRYNRSFGSQFEDAALALRLQREEFLQAFGNSRG